MVFKKLQEKSKIMIDGAALSMQKKDVQHKTETHFSENNQKWFDDPLFSLSPLHRKKRLL